MAVMGGIPLKLLSIIDKERYYKIKNADKLYMKEYYTLERKMI